VKLNTALNIEDDVRPSMSEFPTGTVRAYLNCLDGLRKVGSVKNGVNDSITLLYLEEWLTNAAD
jgi:hypothetical protein